MPQLNPDEAATDESKTYNDEGIGRDEGDLNDIKGDLVDEDDGDEIRQPYDNKVDSHRNAEAVHRRKDDSEREQSNDLGPTSRNFPYPQQDIGPIMPGFNPLFSNGFLPPSSQVPYSPYMGPYMGSLFCGGSSPIDLDGKQVPNRPPSDVPPMYSLPGQLGQIPNHLAPWPTNPLYPALCSAAVTGMLRYPYPFANFSSAGAMGSVPPFPLVPPHPHGGGIHPNMLHHGGLPFPNHINGQNGGPKSNSDKKMPGDDGCSLKRSKRDKPSRPYVKKPLNAFMLYMKEQRAQVVAECTLKESAAINQILGRKWHSLKRDEQQKYYEMARKERQLHMQMFPGWSARDNYGKRKKRKKEKTPDCAAQNPKKCRAVFGLEQQHLWCAPCRRKKKCIRYQQDGDDSDDSDCSPEQYQCSQEFGNYPQTPIGNPDLTAVTNSNSNLSQSDDSISISQSPPSQSSLSERIKQERSPPMPQGGSERLVDPPSSSGTFSSPGFPSMTSASSSSINSASSSSISSKKTNHSPANDFNTAPALSSKHRPSSDEQYPPLNGVFSGGKHVFERLAHTSESPLNNGGNNGPIGRQNIFNSPMLSPSMNINSPHNSPHAFLPNFSYFAAAGLPTSPLGSFLPNFKNFSPMNLGLQGPVSAVPPGTHPGASASRHNTSALEGKS